MVVGIDAGNIRSGGGVTHLVELLRAAQPLAHGISRVVIWSGQETLNQLPTRSWLEHRREPMLEQPLSVRVWWSLVRLPVVAERSCDLLFAPGGGTGRISRPVVTMSQNMLPFAAKEMARYRGSWNFVRLLLVRSMQVRSFRSAAGMIFLSDYARSVITCSVSLKAECCAVIPHGVNSAFRLSPRQQRSVSTYSWDDPFRFLYVSIVDVYKHQWQVVEAIAGLRKEGFPVALDLIGPAYAPALRHLYAAMRRTDPDRQFIRYHGAVPYSQVPGYYQQSDGFVFASSCENMPNILMEAMASGLPIACSTRGPMPEVLRDAGAYFDPENADDIRRALRSLIQDPELRERCAWSAYDRAREFSWERCARDTFSFLADIAGRRIAVSRPSPWMTQ
jgi:glycosyltransferase involved in cell wall biosynthesis